MLHRWSLKPLCSTAARQVEGEARGRTGPQGNITATSPQTKPVFLAARRARRKRRAQHLVVNALGPQFHKGLEPSRYAAGAFPALQRVGGDAADRTPSFVPLADAAAKFAARTSPRKRVVASGPGHSPPLICSAAPARLDNLTLYEAHGKWAKTRRSDRDGLARPHSSSALRRPIAVHLVSQGIRCCPSIIRPRSMGPAQAGHMEECGLLPKIEPAAPKA